MPGPCGENNRVSAVDFRFEMPPQKEMEGLVTGSQSALGLCPHGSPTTVPPCVLLSNKSRSCPEL